MKTIPESQAWDKPGAFQREKGSHPLSAVRSHIVNISQTPVLLASIILTGSLGLGIGLLVQKQNGPPKDPLWIEQLPASVLGGGDATSTQGSETSTTTRSTESQVDDPEKKPTKAVKKPAAATPAATAQNSNGAYVASKTGTKYYLPSCGTAKRIKDSNKVWFNTKTEAAAAGYQPASNCKRL